ncbi:MAG: RidA family protein [Nitriliruptorales bacterium]
MSGDPHARLEELGIVLPEPPAPAAAYQRSREGGGLVFTAGQLPSVEGQPPRTGKLGRDLDTPEGAELAKQAALNVLAIAAAAADGDLGRVRFAKLTVFVASDPAFTEQHIVANGASEFLADVLGEDGLHARSAIGVPVLPLDAPVEVEAILEIRPV